MTIINCGRTITFDKQPQRVLTMGPDAATLVSAAGAAGKIVARNYEFGSSLGEWEPMLKNISPGETVAALIFSTEGPLGAYGKFGTVHNQMEALGLKNIYADLDKAYFEVSIESLLRTDPDVITLLSQKIGETKEQVRSRLLARTELSKLEAIDNDRILTLFYEEAAGSPVAVEGLEKLAQQLSQIGTHYSCNCPLVAIIIIRTGDSCHSTY